MRVLITGGHGQLGRALQGVYAGQPDVAVYAPGHADLDVGDLTRVRQLVADFIPTLIVHAAATTNVDGCESDHEAAFRINALGTRYVALAAAARDVPLVYVSTNYVFDGTKGEPYHEWDRPNPRSVYGRSKLAGEEEARRSPRHYIVRAAWIYGAGPGGNRFVRTMLGYADRGQRSLRAVTDQRGQPTYAPDLAAGIAALARTGAYGLYHLTNSGACSWHEWAVELFRLSGRDVAVEPVPASTFPRPATVPANGVLANWAGAALGIELPDWRDGMRRCLAEMLELRTDD